MKKIFILTIAIVLFVIPARAGEFTILHEFLGGTADGYNPEYTTLTASGTTLFGMTYNGPDPDYGLVFKINADGSGYTHLYAMSGGVGGGYPYGSLTLSSGADELYGMSSDGGSLTWGNVFKVGTDGSSYTQLIEFDRSNGMSPIGSLTLSGSDLYGMTSGEGPNDGGVVFKISTSGGDFSIIYGFSYDSPDSGKNPIGDLTLSNGTLYGMTQLGGASSQGTIFSVDTGGENFTLLHSFEVSEIYQPTGSLTLVGTNLYGMSSNWNDQLSADGAILRIGTDGSNYTLLHVFYGGADDGKAPYGNLTLYNGDFYGTTRTGGSNNRGTIFKIGIDGSDFKLMHSFNISDGEFPKGSLTFIDSTMYGMTRSGGISDEGVIFSYDLGSSEVPEPSTILLLLPFIGLYWLGKRRKG